MFSFSSIPDHQARLSAGQITCVETVRHYLDAIETRRPLNAFLEVYTDEALQRASFLDALPPEQRGRLHGLVIGIKDNILYQGHPATAASALLKGYQAVYSATAVDRLLQEGAIIIGRQNCDEFGMGSTNENSAYGPVLHPNHPDRVPGGSSGGSAAAVKAGLCMASLGSDTGGSVRQPADFCGLVGWKPAYGRVSRHGLIAYASSFDQIGVLANSVEDAAIIYDVIQGSDDYDATSVDAPNPGPQEETAKLRIAYFPEWLDHPSIDPEISSALHALLDRLASEGHRVEPVSFSLTDFIVPSYYILTTAEASSNLARFDGVRYGAAHTKKNAGLSEFYQQNRSQGFGLEVKRRVLLGSFVLSSGYYDAYYTKAQQIRRLLQEQTSLIFNEFDLIIAPNSPSVAYPVDRSDQDPLAIYMGDIFTVFANLTGLPAISLPLFKHSSNVPFGVQVLSSRQNEVVLLRFSHRLMQQ